MSVPIKVVRVTFQGHRLWMYENWRLGDDGPLIPRHHVDETSEHLHWRSFWPQEFSFGHALFGRHNQVWQHGKIIGRADEIVDGWPEEKPDTGRADRILAALQEPSEKLLESVNSLLFGHPLDKPLVFLSLAIRTAVQVAEQEVDA